MSFPTSSILFRRLTTKAKLRHLEVLVHLGQYGSMGKTAEALRISQPAVSQTIADLERLLEVELFLRHARGVEPTDVTRDLLPVARRILTAVADAADLVAGRLADQTGHVRVYATAAALGGMLQPMLPDFAEKYPRVHVNVTEAGGPDPLEYIAKAECDILCLRQSPVVPEGWVFEACLNDRLIVVCAKSHPLAAKAAASLEQLGQCHWLMNRIGSVARNRFEDVAAKAGWPNEIQRPVVTHIPNLTLQMLSTGKYLTIVPRSMALPWLEAGMLVELECDVSSALPPLGFLWQPDRAGLAARQFAGRLKQLRID